MFPEIYFITTPGPGRLAVLPRPRGGDWLEDEILGLRKFGVDVLVSLLQPDEELFLGLEEEGKLAKRHGLTFVSHPVPDRSVPDSPKATWAVAKSLAGLYGEGKTVAAHCRMGIGRSPLLLACILALRGVEPDDAWAAIGLARGCTVPDTMEQRDWLERTRPS